MRPFWIILRYELLRSWRERTFPALLLVAAGAVAFAAWNGRTWTLDRQRAIEATVRDTAKFRDDVVERYAAAIQRAPERAQSIGALVAGIWYRPTLPVAPLAALTVGQADGYPFDLRFHPSNALGIFAPRAVTVANPEVRTAGRFDLAFVVVTLLPMLLLAATFDVWAAERESGIARLLGSQPVAPAKLIGAKLLARGGAVLLPFILILAVAAVWAAPAAAGLASLAPGLASLTLLVLAYGAFWLLIAGAINTVAAGSSQAALLAGAIWLLVVALLPAGLATLRDLKRQAPSGPAQISALRGAELEIEHRRSERAAANWGRSAQTTRNNLIRSSLDTNTEEQALMEKARGEFLAQEAARRDWANRVRFIAPSLLAQDTLERIAGTDAGRASAFRVQGLEFITSLRDFVRANLKDGPGASAEEFLRVTPVFTFHEPAGRERSGPLIANFAALGAFIAAALLLLSAAAGRLLPAARHLEASRSGRSHPTNIHSGP